MLQKARMLQLAWFTTSPEPSSPLALFAEMFGREPDAFQKLQPPQAPFPITVQGFVEDDVEHKVQSYAGRIDYIISAVQQAPELPLLEAPVDELLARGLTAVDRAAGFIGNISRGSIVLTLSEKIHSMEEGARFFTSLFGGSVNFEDKTDLMFQMNRRTKGHLEVTDINSVHRWNTEALQVQQMAIIPGFAGTTAGGGLVDMLYLNYMLDVNTVPFNGVFNSSEHAKVFAALAEITSKSAQLDTIQDL